MQFTPFYLKTMSHMHRNNMRSYFTSRVYFIFNLFWTLKWKENIIYIYLIRKGNIRFFVWIGSLKYDPKPQKLEKIMMFSSFSLFSCFLDGCHSLLSLLDTFSNFSTRILTLLLNEGIFGENSLAKNSRSKQSSSRLAVKSSMNE